MQRKLLGDAHPDLAGALNNLAYAREVHGNLRGAEAAYREALAMNRKLLGERHPEVANTMSNIAFVTYAEGRHREAVDLLRASLDMRRDLLGNEHPDVASSAANLAYLLIDSGINEDAGQLIEQSLAMRRKLLGPDHPSVATTLTVRAYLLLTQRKYAAAMADTEEADRILAPRFAASQWQRAMALNVHGAALAGLGKFALAEKELLSSLDPLSGAPIPNAAARGRQRLAQLYTAWGKPEMAQKYLHQ